MSSHRERGFVRATQLLVLAALGRVLWRSSTAPINEDELEVLQVLWLFDHGQIFHLDYVYPHLPTLALLLAPLYRWFGPGIELAEAVRFACLPVLAVLLTALAWLARRLSGHGIAGWLAVGFVTASPALVTMMIETRGDLFSVTLVLLGLVAFARSWTGQGFEGSGLLRASLAFGLSALFNQKGVFVALATLACVDHFHVRAGLGLGTRVRSALAFVAVGMVPFLGAVTLLGLAGITDWRSLMLVVTTGQWVLNADLFGEYKPYVLFRTVLLLPVPWLLALVAIGRRRLPTDSPLARVLSSALLVTLLYLGVEQIYTLQLMWLPLCLAAVLAALGLSARRACIGFVVLGCTLAFAALDPHRDEDDLEAQRARMSWVLEHVPEDRVVIDGRLGLEAFRPLVQAPAAHRLQQYRPWSYSPGFRAVHEAAVLRAIASGEVGAVVLHPNVQLIPEDVWNFILQKYEASEHPDILVPGDVPLWQREPGDP